MSNLAVSSSIYVKVFLENEEILGNQSLVLNVNNVRFTIIDRAILSLDPLKIDLQDRNIIIISPIKSNSSVQISAVSIIALSTIEAMGPLCMKAKNKLTYMGTQVLGHLKGGALVGMNGMNFKSMDAEVLQGLVEKFENGIDTRNPRLLIKSLVESIREVMTNDSEEEEHSDEEILRYLGVPIVERNYCR